MRGRRFKTRNASRPKLDEAQVRSLSLDGFTHLAVALEAWGSLVEELVDSKGSGSTVNVVSDNIRAWLLSNKDTILAEGQLAPYLEMVCLIGRIQGQEIQQLLERMIAPEPVQAPPMRDF